MDIYLCVIPIESTDPYDWTEIKAACSYEGSGMVDRLLADFRTGLNRFDMPGEGLFVYLQGQKVIAVAGLNQEPDPHYPEAGRIRRLYVLPEYRSSGLARGLIEAIASHADNVFEKLTVNAGLLEVGGFYEHLGFSPVRSPSVTHVKEL